MTKTSKRITIVSVIAILCFVAVYVVAVKYNPAFLGYRLNLIVLKSNGELSDVSWNELFNMIRPGSHYDLQKLKFMKNTTEDIEKGKTIFRTQCAMCHGPHGEGGIGANLRNGIFQNGSSDWALHRTITRGVPGTKMAAQQLTDKQTWQAIAFIRSLIKQELAQSAGKSEKKNASININIPYKRLLEAGKDAKDWLTYSGSYASTRFSLLDKINQSNVSKLHLLWVRQLQTVEEKNETTPLVVNGTMFLTDAQNDVIALNARNGNPLWKFSWHPLPRNLALCCGHLNRGLAVLDDKLYMGTMDAHLVALDAASGKLVWETKVDDWHKGVTITSAPLAVKNMIIIGVSGGEFGIRGHIDAYNATTGKRVWRFYTVPGPGEKGHDTWEGDTWKTGSAPAWNVGSYDPKLNLLYWGTGNPSPEFLLEQRGGVKYDNLFSNCVVALNPDTGKLKWHFQFTPHDEHDWDATQIPVLVNETIAGTPRELLLQANRNAFYYILDRSTGQFISAHPFAKQTWAKSIDKSGRPILTENSSPSLRGTVVYPSIGAAANWWPPSYSPQTGLLYVTGADIASTYYRSAEMVPHRDRHMYVGSAEVSDYHRGRGFVRAIVAKTGQIRWEHELKWGHGLTKLNQKWAAGFGGLLTTGGSLVFGGVHDRFYALDDKTGKELWHFGTGGTIAAAPMTYQIDGHQYITVAAGRSIFTFGISQ